MECTYTIQISPSAITEYRGRVRCARWKTDECDAAQSKTQEEEETGVVLSAKRGGCRWSQTECTREIEKEKAPVSYRPPLTSHTYTPSLLI